MRGLSEERGQRTKAFVYSADLLVDVPAIRRNTWLRYSADENGGFRLRDYVGGRMTEVSRVGAIVESLEFERRYAVYRREFDEDETATPLTDIEYWEKRINRVNEMNRELLAKDEERIAQSKS